MVFNGSTNAFSNTGFVFPASSYSLFAVYSNTTAPASTAYMNVAYGSNGFPMVGVYDATQYVSARSVVGNTGALTTIAPGGWVAQTASDGNDGWRQLYADSNENVYVNGDYGIASTTVAVRNADGSTGATLPPASRAGMVAKYSPTGSLIWAAAMSNTAGADVYGLSVTADQSGNMFISSGYFAATMTISNATSVGGSGLTVPYSGGSNADTFVAKYSSNGTVLWVAQITTSNVQTIYPRSIATDSSGNVAVCGEMYGGPVYVNSAVGSGGPTVSFPFSATTSDGWIAKYSSTGIALWGARITSGNSMAIGQIASDSIGNTYLSPNGTNTTVTFYSAPAVGGSMSLSGAVFLVKYSPNGTVLWAVALPGGGRMATDSSNNVFVTYNYGSGATTVYNATLAAGGGGSAAVTLPFAGGTSDVAIVKYSSSGTVLWAAGLGSSGNDGVSAISTDSNGNVLVCATYPSAPTINNATTIGGSRTAPIGTYVVKYSSSGTVLSINKTANGLSFIDSFGNGYIGNSQFGTATFSLSNSDGTTATTLTKVGASWSDTFVAKYSPTGFITSSPVPANSNTMVSSIYPSSTAMASFTNGVPMTALSGTVAATTGLYLGGPSNYFSGTLSELLVFSNALTSTERQRIEGYLANKWSTRGSLPSDHPYKSVAPTP
jgi:hypothetical protein